MAYLDKMRNLAEDAYGAARGMRDETEKKVFEALNNKSWGASSTVLSEIARETFSYEKFGKIFKLIWEAADAAPRNWRKIFKALLLCEYLVKNGCERCVDEARDHGFRLRQLTDFQYHEERLDRGQGVRDKAKQLLELLSDNANIREAREAAKRLRDKFNGQATRNFSGHGSDGYGGSSSYAGYGGGGYSDNGGGSYSDKDAAQGRYAAEEAPLPRPDEPRAAEAGLQLKLKPKAKAVPRIKMKGDTAAPEPAAEEDLFGAGAPPPTEPAVEPRPTNGQSLDLFDAFQETPPAFDPRGSDFAAFDSAPPVQSFQQQPDPFVVVGGSQYGSPPPPAPQPPAQQLPPQPPQMMMMMPPPAVAAPPRPAPPVADDGFGDFDAAPAVDPPKPLEPPEPVDALAKAVSSLGSLDSLSLNANAKAPAPAAANRATYAQHAAFTGLDGFTTSPQPTMMTGQQPYYPQPMAPGLNQPAMHQPVPPQQQQPAMAMPHHHTQMAPPMAHQQQPMRPQQAAPMGYPGNQPYAPQQPYAAYPQQQPQYGAAYPQQPQQPMGGYGAGMPSW